MEWTKKLRLATPAPAEKIIMKVGSTVQDTASGGKALIEDFKTAVEKNSNGRIEVQVYNNSVLGGDRQLYEALQLGTVQASFGPLSVLANFEPKYKRSRPSVLI